MAITIVAIIVALGGLAAWRVLGHKTVRPTAGPHVSASTVRPRSGTASAAALATPTSPASSALNTGPGAVAIAPRP